MGANLYDTDFCAWAQRQAELIRAGRLAEVDFEHVAEEIESMGRSEAREAVSRLTVLLAHLLKWQHQPERREPEISGRSWRRTLTEQRRSLAKLFRDSPSLRARLPELIVDAYPDAAEFARLETGLIDPPWSADECPYSPGEVMADDFLPQ
ncbi:MAG TPA: DUF29 domain-containing protein [Plasticicumulans sp.]|uniref:DUF29 domain-containing protein n=1 Tax=Plasticicumulans sp. TaxID=2307179 RepID=UPI002BD64DAE|nr:DUF29 domain-containing protein [Plasticicumulans sp.]HNE02261.1 DUF29 domain-containing protein [Plasticicumulans sp.]HNO60947.1 DUF29 domain-containing protein [Plasticicumulans sp.]